MKNWKKVLALVLATGMTLSLAACNGGGSTASTAPSDTGSGEGGGSTSGNVSIELWTYPIGQFGDQETLDGIIAAFKEVHPEIDVTIQLLDYTNGDTQVTSAITAGTTPDIIMEGPERLVSNYGANGLMVDLSDLWTEEATADISAVSEAVVNACKGSDGVYYEYPLCMTTHCMAINYEVFEAAGALQYIDEETRTWTTDDFVAAMEAVRDAAAAGTVNVMFPGIIYCGGPGGDQGTRALVNNLYSGTYTNAEHTEYTANSPENVEALTLLKSMVDNGSLTADSSFQAADELQQFANGTAAVTFCWNASNQSQYAEQVQFTPFAMAFPSDDGEPELCGGIYGFGIFDHGDEAKIEAAKEFIRFVCDDAEQGPESVRLSGFFPVRDSFGNVYEGTENEARMSEFQVMMPYLGDYYNVIGGWTEQRTNWYNMLQQIFVSGADIQTAADEFVTASNANI